VTGRVIAILAISAGAIAATSPAAASAAKSGSIFDITSARGFERVTFEGLPQGQCEQFATCGYKGVVTYEISGTPKGTLLLARSRSGRYSGGATYRTHGVTTSDVSGPEGTAPCSDTVAHKADVFSMTSLPNSAPTVLLSYHDGGDDYLTTACAGPTEAQVGKAGGVPDGTFAAGSFRNKRVKWTLSGGQPFKANGYQATSEWDLKFKGRGRYCNPHCRIPAQRPR
jgi:hypothetical protein